MEVSGAVIRRSVGVRWGGSGESNPYTRNRWDGARPKAALALRRWSDDSHSLYYASSRRCSGVRDTQREEVERIAAFGTDLSKELAALYSTGLDAASEAAIADEIRGKMIKEASEQLLVQLNQKKSKEKEMKKRNKEDAAALKSQKMLDCGDESSSSSSSESSDSESEEVVGTNIPTKTLKEVVVPESLDVPDRSPECIQVRRIAEKAELTSMSSLKIDRISRPAAVASCSNTKLANKIEVCLGGKCRKSGSVELLQELQKEVGVEGAVIGCKCMGKCRQGPNVRVLNHGRSSPEGELAEKLLCVGVGLDDVGAIAAKFLGQNDGMDMGLLAA